MATDALSKTDRALKNMLADLRRGMDIILQSTWEILDPLSPKFKSWNADQYEVEVRIVFRQMSKRMSFQIQQIITSTADNIRATMVEYGVDRESATFKSTEEEGTVLVGVYLQMYNNSIQTMIETTWPYMAQDFISWCRTNTNTSKEIANISLHDRLKSIFCILDARLTQQFQSLRRSQLYVMEVTLSSAMKRKIAENLDAMLNATVKRIELAKLSFRSKLATCQGNPWDEETRNFLQDVMDLCVLRLQCECASAVNAANKQVLSNISSLQTLTFSYTTRVTAIFQDLNAELKAMIENCRQSVGEVVTKQFETQTKLPVEEFKQQLMNMFTTVDPSPHIKIASMKLQSEMQEGYVHNGV